jgi:hypothetical protein
MSDRRNRLPPARIAELFCLANGNPSSLGGKHAARIFKGKRLEPITEGERVEAVNELLREFRTQVEQFRRKDIPHIDPLLAQGMNDWSIRIFAEDNPVLALEKLIGTRPKEGRRASTKNADRDITIALAVLEKMRSGMTLDKAAEAVTSEFAMEAESIANIYKRKHKELKAAIAMADLESKRE